MKHIPVLLEEALHYLNIDHKGIYVDCTLGGGGHSEAILKRIPQGHLYAFDQDPFAITQAREKLIKVADNFTIIQTNFKNIKSSLQAHDVTDVDGILYDLGVSSFHFDDPERGFSYNHNATLDMRMDPTQSLTAAAIINDYSPGELKRVLMQYGEEKYATNIIHHILKQRQLKPIQTTFELVDIIKQSLPQKVLKQKGHPAKKTFQALRIEVNKELDVLAESLEHAINMLKPNGRLVVISFHSLEDRIVKQMFKKYTTIDHPKEILTMPEETPDFELLHRKVIIPKIHEITENQRAHSAKLRAIKKIDKNQ